MTHSHILPTHLFSSSYVSLSPPCSHANKRKLNHFHSPHASDTPASLPMNAPIPIKNSYHPQTPLHTQPSLLPPNVFLPTGDDCGLLRRATVFRKTYRS